MCHRRLSMCHMPVSSFCVNVRRCLVASLFEVRVMSLRRVYRGMSKKGNGEKGWMGGKRTVVIVK